MFPRDTCNLCSRHGGCRPAARHSHLAAITAAAVLGVVSLMVCLPPANAAVSPATVRASINKSGIVLRPAAVPSGPVVFRVLNRTGAPRDFRITTHRTRVIRAGRSALLTVTLRQPGLRNVFSVAETRAPRVTGQLGVFQACMSPSTTTVTVQLGQGQGGLTVSQSVIPCGTVTFVVTDTGSLGDSLLVFGVTPSVRALTPDLLSGQTARLTVRFPAKGTVYIQSGTYQPAEPEYGGDFNEFTALTLV